MIDNPSSSAVIVVVGSPITLSCTSRGSPPDIFTFMKDGIPVTPSPSITAVSHTNTIAVFRADYSITSATSVHAGTYTCTVTNPIGSDSETIIVNVTGWSYIKILIDLIILMCLHVRMFYSISMYELNEVVNTVSFRIMNVVSSHFCKYHIESDVHMYCM